MERVRIALIGCGGIARGHVEAYARMGDLCRLVACVDPDEAKAKAYAAQAGCRWAADYREVLDEVDAVDICTPPHLHAPLAIAAAGKGKHVLTEKVMATTLEDADEMIRVADASGVRLMVAYVTRFDPAWITLHDAVQGGAAGRPYLVAGRTAHHPSLASWRASWETFPMGALLSHGCHYVDQMIWNFGDIGGVLGRREHRARPGAGAGGYGGGHLPLPERRARQLPLLLGLGARRLRQRDERLRHGRLPAAALPAGRGAAGGAGRRAGDGGALRARPAHGAGGAEELRRRVRALRGLHRQRQGAPDQRARRSRKSMAAILAAYQGDDENRILWLEPGASYAADPAGRARPGRG